MNHLKFEYLGFVSALGLMSRIPVSLLLGKQKLTSEHHNRAQIWYPWVGAVLGVLLLIWVWITPDDWSSFSSAVVLVIIWVSFTGAFHLDGLADSVDAWVGGMVDKRGMSGNENLAEKTLAIMKDPTSGPMAVVALVLILLLKVALMAEILSSLHGASFVLLALIPTFARAWLLPFLYTTPYARHKKFDAQNIQTSELASRQGGMATDIASAFPEKAALTSFGVGQVAALLSLLFLGWSLWVWLGLNLAALVVCILIRNVSMNRIGGYTGDVLGALIELQEVTLLFMLTISATLLI